jgi:DNA-binding transcriptional ArsR family regulator
MTGNGKSPIARALDELLTERAHLAARLEKVEGLITTMQELFHLPARVLATVNANAHQAKGKRAPQASGNGRGISVDAIRGALQHGPKSPGELAQELGVPRARLRYHLAQLEEDGIVVATGVTANRKVALPSGKAAKEAP